MDFLLHQLPPQLQALPVLLAGFLALLGLLLWSAGIKAARPLIAAFLGATLAPLAAWLLPTFTGLGELPSGLIGLAIGVFIGAVAFRAMQGVLLATCLGLAAAGAFYRWQAPTAHPTHPHTAASVPAIPAFSPTVTFQEFAQRTLHAATAQWTAIPPTLRQSMIVIAAGVAILALAIAWILPRYTTWLTTAAAGTALILLGGLTLLHLYGPQFEHFLPATSATRLGALAILVLLGMLLQHLFFWPAKARKPQPAPAA